MDIHSIVNAHDTMNAQKQVELTRKSQFENRVNRSTSVSYYRHEMKRQARIYNA